MDAPAVAKAVKISAEAWLRSDAAEGWLLGRLEGLSDWLVARDALLAEVVPLQLQELLLELAGHGYAPDRELALFLLDREPVRKLLRDLFLDELLAFGRKLRAPVVENPLARGLGGLGRIARDRAKSSGAFGALASDMVGAVSGELERQLDRKALEFADAALSRLLQRLADLISDPEAAREQAVLRQALLEGIFELETGEIAYELERSEAQHTSAALRRWLLAWLESPHAESDLVGLLEGLFGAELEVPLGEFLDTVGLLESWEGLAKDLAERRIRALVTSEAFADWLVELLEESDQPDLDEAAE